MVEKIQPVSPPNFLYNMVKIFTNTDNTLMPRPLRTPFGAQHESTGLCKRKGASPHPQLERGQSKPPTGKGPVHIPNRKGAMQNAWIRAPHEKWPKKMPGALTLPPWHPLHYRCR